MSGSKEERVHAVFQTISRRYDRMNDIISLGMHRRWKRELTALVRAQKPRRVLDVCCGTGDLSLAIARENPAARVTGLDFSDQMLAVAARRLAAAPLENVDFVQGNTLALPFGAGAFDCAVISFGLRNLPDYEKAVAELARVTRGGGLVLCLDSSYPESPLVRPFYKLYFKHLVSLLGGRERAEYRWLYDSTEQFLTKGELLALFRAQGLEDCACRRYLFGAAARHSGRRRAV